MAARVKGVLVLALLVLFCILAKGTRMEGVAMGVNIALLGLIVVVLFGGLSAL